MFSAVRRKSSLTWCKKSTSTNRIFISHFGSWLKSRPINSIFQRIITFCVLLFRLVWKERSFEMKKGASKWKVNVIMEFFLSQNVVVASSQYLRCAAELSTSSLSLFVLLRAFVFKHLFISLTLLLSLPLKGSYRRKYSRHDFWFYKLAEVEAAKMLLHCSTERIQLRCRSLFFLRRKHHFRIVETQFS